MDRAELEAITGDPDNNMYFNEFDFLGHSLQDVMNKIRGIFSMFHKHFYEIMVTIVFNYNQIT